MSSDASSSPYRLSLEDGDVKTNLRNEAAAAIAKLNAAAAVIANILPGISDALGQIDTPESYALTEAIGVALNGLTAQLVPEHTPVV